MSEQKGRIEIFTFLYTYIKAKTSAECCRIMRFAAICVAWATTQNRSAMQRAELFVSGRTGHLTDVWIDVAGASLVGRGGPDQLGEDCGGHH